MRAKDLAAAEKLLAAALKLAPSDPRLLALDGARRELSGDLRGAEEAYGRAAGASPADLPSRWAQARLASARGDEGRKVAAAEVDAALAQAPNNLFLLVRRVELARALHDAPAAASATDRLARLAAGDERVERALSEAAAADRAGDAPDRGPEVPDRREHPPHDAALPAGAAGRRAAVRGAAARRVVAGARGGHARPRGTARPGEVRPGRRGGPRRRRRGLGRPGRGGLRPRSALRGPRGLAHRGGVGYGVSARGDDPGLVDERRGRRRRDELGLARRRDPRRPLDPRRLGLPQVTRSPEASGSFPSTSTPTETSTSTWPARPAITCSATISTGPSPTSRRRPGFRRAWPRGRRSPRTSTATATSICCWRPSAGASRCTTTSGAAGSRGATRACPAAETSGPRRPAISMRTGASTSSGPSTAGRSSPSTVATACSSSRSPSAPAIRPCSSTTTTTASSTCSSSRRRGPRPSGATSARGASRRRPSGRSRRRRRPRRSISTATATSISFS